MSPARPIRLRDPFSVAFHPLKLRPAAMLDYQVVRDHVLEYVSRVRYRSDLLELYYLILKLEGRSYQQVRRRALSCPPQLDLFKDHKLDSQKEPYL